ncbi:MAG TPA: PQQ-binding-like beta-propeller repeat protein, partial [Anaerolineales bacterium]|nr:PQQ-binding-like beta-propeller repeat protein [Anaerolineales bacterium]
RTFILYSKRNERNRTIAWVATGIVLIIMSVLTYFAVQESRLALANEKLAKSNEALAISNEKVAKTNEQIARTNEQEAKAQKAIAEENRKIAEAQRSAARAQIYQTRPGELYTSTLLAIDSWQSIPSDEAEEILRKNISLLPLPVAQVSQAGNINSIGFSPGGESFVTASADGTACAWDIGNGKKLFCASSPKSVNEAVFSPDGKFIITGDDSGLVQVLDAENGSVQNQYQRVKPDNASGTIQIVDLKNGNSQNKSTPLEIPVRNVSLKPSTGGQLAIAYDDGKIPVIDLKTGKISSPLEIGGKPHVSGFSPNGNWLAAGSESGVVTIWNLSNRKIISGFKHRDGVLALAFSPNNRVMATGGKDNTALITDLRTGSELFRLPNQNWVRAIAFSPDGSWLVTGSDDHRIRIWDTSNGKERLGMLQDSIVTDVAVSSNGQWIATTGLNKTVWVWNASTGAEIFRIPLGASGAVLAFSNDGKYLVSSDQRGVIQTWDISVMAASEKYVQFNGIVDNVQYSPAGDRLVVSDENRVWLLSPEPLSDLLPRPQGVPILQLKSRVKEAIFSPDSKFLGLLSAGNEVAIYNIDKRGSKTLKVSAPIRAIAFSPDSQQLMTSDSNGNVQAWDVLNAQLIDNAAVEYPQASSLDANAEFLAMGSKDKIALMELNDGGTFSEIKSQGDNTLLGFSADGSMLAATDSSGQINLWKYQGGQFTALKPFIKEQAVSLAFNPKGTLLAVGTAQNAFLIDTTTAEEVARIPHIDNVNGVSFSEDGNILATASSKALQFWDIAKIRQIKKANLDTTACSRLIENFDASQWHALFGDEAYRPLCPNLPVPQ